MTVTEIRHEDLPLRFDQAVRPLMYQISHGVLVLRTHDHKTDLVFLDVRGMKLLSRFASLVISAAGSRPEIDEFVEIPERFEAKFLKLILSDGKHEGFVVCGALRVKPSENPPY